MATRCFWTTSRKPSRCFSMLSALPEQISRRPLVLLCKGSRNSELYLKTSSALDQASHTSQEAGIIATKGLQWLKGFFTASEARQLKDLRLLCGVWPEFQISWSNYADARAQDHEAATIVLRAWADLLFVHDKLPSLKSVEQLLSVWQENSAAKLSKKVDEDENIPKKMLEAKTKAKVKGKGNPKPIPATQPTKAKGKAKRKAKAKPPAETV